MNKKIGFKQVIQRDWIQKTIQIYLSGMKTKDIKIALQDYILQKPLQTNDIRSKGSVSSAVTMLMHIWIEPNISILPVRDDALQCLRNNSNEEIIVDWIMLSLSYPFWFQVSKQVGKLLKFQEFITQKQLVLRLKEVYGDRETISRNARYALRTLISWGLLIDSKKKKGCYEKGIVITPSIKTISLLFESALVSQDVEKKEYHQLYHEPAFFSFNLDFINSYTVEQMNSRLCIERFGGNQEFITIRKKL